MEGSHRTGLAPHYPLATPSLVLHWLHTDCPHMGPPSPPRSLQDLEERMHFAIAAENTGCDPEQALWLNDLVRGRTGGTVHTPFSF